MERQPAGGIDGATPLNCSLRFGARPFFPMPSGKGGNASISAMIRPVLSRWRCGNWLPDQIAATGSEGTESGAAENNGEQGFTNAGDSL